MADAAGDGTGGAGAAKPKKEHPAREKKVEYEDTAEDGEGEKGDGDSDTTERTDVEETLVKSLRRLGLKAPKPFNPKKDNNFKIWLERIEHHFKVANIPDEANTSSLVLLLDLDGYEIARHLDIKDDLPFEEVKTKLKH